MSNGINFRWYQPIPTVIRDVGVNKNLMLFAAKEWHRLYFPFTPYREGFLAEDVRYDATESKAFIYHIVPYSGKMYHNPHFNFNRARHTLASAYWDRAALSAGKGDALRRAVQKYLDRGLT